MDREQDTSMVADMVRRPGGRPAAGTDPEKRRQIVEGAVRVFTSVGFDAASMSDIAREANVSKPTLYVYFSSKEQLFASVCAERRDRSIAELVGMLDRDGPIEEVLASFGREAVGRLMQPYVVAAHRIVIGVAERMPEIGREFFEAGAMRLIDELAALLTYHASTGRLRLEDATLAAAQFLELSQACVFRPGLYAARTSPPSDAEINRTVASAVRMFLAAYGASGSGA